MIYDADYDVGLFCNFYSGNGLPPNFSDFHRHNTDELVIVEQGVSRIVTEDNVYKCSGAFAIYYPAGLAHNQFNDISQTYVRYCIDFKPSFVEELLPAGSLPHTFFLLPLEPDEAALLIRYLMLLHAEYEPETTAPPDKIWRQKYLLALILNELSGLMRLHLSGTESRRLTCGRLVRDICLHINEHCSEPLTLDSIAGHFFISRSKLIRSFRSELDISVGDYILNTRIGKAKRLLYGGSSVHETSQSCGFSNDGYFIKVFRSATGMTPAKYRTEQERLDRESDAPPLMG